MQNVSCRALSSLLFGNLAALSAFLSLFLLAGWIKLLWNRIWRAAQGWPKITVWLKKWENGVGAKWKYSNVSLPLPLFVADMQKLTSESTRTRSNRDTHARTDLGVTIRRVISALQTIKHWCVVIVTAAIWMIQAEWPKIKTLWLKTTQISWLTTVLCAADN